MNRSKRTTKPELFIIIIIFFIFLVSCNTPNSNPTQDPPTESPKQRPLKHHTKTKTPSNSSQIPSTSPPSFSKEELSRRVHFLASDTLQGRDEGTPGGLRARAFIIEELKKCSISPLNTNTYEQPIKGTLGANILALIPGKDPSLQERTLLLSAHYDHIGTCGGEICNGADDNAAAVAILIETACALQKSPLSHPLLIAAWDAEEPPTFLSAAMGSQFFVNNPPIPLQNIDVAIAMDLVGGGLWDGFSGHFISGAELSPEIDTLLDTVTAPKGLLVRRIGLHSIEETPYGHQPWSDYDAFRNQEIPILFLSNGQTQRYHQTDDEADTLDYPKMLLQTQHLWNLLQALDTLPTRPTFHPHRIDHLRDAQSLADLLPLTLADGGLFDSLSLNPLSRATSARDLAKIQKLLQKLDAGETPDAKDTSIIRVAIQRIMCFASPLTPEMACLIL